jgi:hypothetical protein
MNFWPAAKARRAFAALKRIEWRPHGGLSRNLEEGRMGRLRAANRRGIPNTGTHGVLRTAAIRNLLDLPTALKRLAETNFRISKSLLAQLLAEDAERKLSPPPSQC